MFILAVGIFGVGYLAAPEAVTVTEKDTKVVTVQLPAKTEVVERVEVQRQPLAASCLAFLEGNKAYYLAVTEYAGEMSRVGPSAISEGRKALAGGSITGTIKPLEELNDLSFATGEVASKLLSLESDLDLLARECEADTKK